MRSSRGENWPGAHLVTDWSLSQWRGLDQTPICVTMVCNLLCIFIKFANWGSVWQWPEEILLNTAEHFKGHMPAVLHENQEQWARTWCVYFTERGFLNLSDWKLQHSSTNCVNYTVVGCEHDVWSQEISFGVFKRKTYSFHRNNLVP